MKKGDKVKLRSDSRYMATRSNPKIGSKYECEGVIGSYSPSSGTIVVLWENGCGNTYNECDLDMSDCGCCVSMW